MQMKPILFLAAILTIAAGVTVALSMNAFATDKSHLSQSQTTEIGRVKAGVVIETNVSLSYAAFLRGDVSIAGTAASCGCTVAESAVGEGSAEHALAVTINTSGQKEGLTEITVVVTYSDGAKEVFPIRFIVERGIPAVVDLGHVLRGATEVWRFPVDASLVDLGQAPSVEGKILDPAYAESNDAETSHALAVTVRPSAVSGAFVNHVLVATPDGRRQKVSFKGYVKDELEISRRKVALEPGSRLPVGTVLCSIYAPYGKPFELTGISLYEGIDLPVQLSANADGGVDVVLTADLDETTLPVVAGGPLSTIAIAAESDGENYRFLFDLARAYRAAS